jgi:hypothetical protein
MKKLFIIFLLSLAFVGSANANSIDGAFGYKLGQVVEDATGIDYVVGRIEKYNLSKTFVPQKPLPGDFTYYLYTTLKDKKVFKFWAIDPMSLDSHDDCSAKSGLFFKIMKIFELKYGKFVKTNTEEVHFSGNKWKALNNSYTDGHREILIRCRSSNSDQHRISITYIDYILEKIQNEEAENALKKELIEIEQKFIDDASEYDI